MAFTNGSGGGQQAEINVTPLIDVLLVLLIIFMIIVPMKPDGLQAAVPQQPKVSAPENPSQPLVLEVRGTADGQASYLLNQQPVAAEDLVGRLQGVFAIRQERQMFVKADAALNFGVVARAIGLAHEAHAETIGILTPKDERR